MIDKYLDRIMEVDLKIFKILGSDGLMLQVLHNFFEYDEYS